MATSVKQMMEAANAAVPRVTPAQAREMIAKGNTLVVDVRDAPEVEKTGKVAGAVHVSRGMLEFRADPDSPYHDKSFDKAKTVILYCASGGRSALGGKVLKDMGYQKVYNLGAFKDWIVNGGLFERADGSKPGATVLACIGAGLAGIVATSIAALALLTTIPQAKSMTWDAVNAAPAAKTLCRPQFDAE
jgi:rhodanese-related sulfurtransferase